jgi:hypothetical protein
VCEEQVGDRTIDFLKVDVEGYERSVLEGADFAQFRPRIIVIEATEPGTQVPSHESWEHLVLDAAYRFVLFDGINRFYLREEDRALAPRLTSPANCLDDFVTIGVSQLREEAEQLRSKTTRLDQLAARLGDELTEARRFGEEQMSRVRELELALADTRDELARSRRALGDARAELTAARTVLTESLGCTGANADQERSGTDIIEQGREGSRNPDPVNPAG